MNLSFFRKYAFECLLVLKAAVSLWLLLWICPPLFPDEAQYWVWSQHLDLGYYSKPPAIAWIIALSTSLLGHSEEAIRLPSLVMSSLAAWYLMKAMGRLGAREASAKFACWLFVFSPLVLYGSFAATTDVGLLLGWCAICYYLEAPENNGRDRAWLLFWAMWAFLFKPSILALTAFSWLRFWDKERVSKSTCLTLGCLLGALFPLIWNIEHDFVTFKHVWTQLVRGDSHSAVAFTSQLSLKRPLELLAAQILLFSPWVFARLILAAKQTWTKAWGPLRWHGMLAALILGFTLISSFRIKFQANWPLIAFPSLFCLLAQSTFSRRWVMSHAAVHSALFLMALGIFYGQAHDKSWKVLTSKNLNLFKTVQGWQSLSEQLPELPWREGEGFWISDRYQSCSLLSFYGPSQDVFWFNLHGARKNQFSFWSVPDRFLGAPARVVLVDNCSLEEMRQMAPLATDKIKPYFDRVKQIHVVPMWVYQDKVQRCALVIDLEGYTGSRPQDPHSY